MNRPQAVALQVRDTLTEAATGLLQRPVRSALTALGTVLGVGAFVAVLGLTASATSQIGARFDALTDTEVTITDGRDPAVENPVPIFPDQVDALARRVHGVLEAGVTWSPRSPGPVSSLPDGGSGVVQPPVIAATPGYLHAVGLRLEQGRIFDAWLDRGRRPVAVLGSAAATALGITTLQTQPAVFVGGRPFLVIGIFDDTQRRSDLLSAVVVPASLATQIWGTPKPDDKPALLAVTQVGAARQAARELPVAIRPDAPDALVAHAPPDPRSLRENVGTDLSALFIALAGICLVIGALGIANTTLVSVMERSSEIGLRRALGGQPRQIATQFLCESAALGSIGGLIGTSLGTIVVVTVSVIHDWTPVIAPATLVAGPVAGLATGLLAGLYPAVRASGVEPTEALRR